MRRSARTALRALAATRLTDRVWSGEVSSEAAARDCLRMAEIVHGGRASIEQDPVLFANVNVNSPLHFDVRMLEGLLTYADAGQAVIVTPFLLMGAMAPVTVPAALVQQITEALAGIALVQLVRSGTPCVMGSFLSATDMKSGSPSFGGPESAMGLFSKDIATLDDLFLHTLQDIYYAENQITKALPKMIDKATSPDLKAGFEVHLSETEGQIRRLDQVFGLLGKEPQGVTCPAIDGIIKEANEIAGDIADKKVLDAALIAAAQAVEHYEITRYGTLIAWANQLGQSQAASILAETLAEEKATDEKLTTMAEGQVNAEAEFADA